MILLQIKERYIVHRLLSIKNKSTFINSLQKFNILYNMGLLRKKYFTCVLE